MSFQFVKSHPWMLGALIFGILALFLISKNKATGATTSIASTGVSADYLQSQVAAGSALQLANMQAVSQINSDNFQLALEAQKEAADFQMAQLQGTVSTTQQVNYLTSTAGVQSQAIQTQAVVSQQQIQASLDAQLSADALALDQTKINAARDVSTASISAGRDVSIASISADAQKAISANTTAAYVDLGALAANSQTVVAQYGRDVALASIQGQVDLATQQMDNNAKVDQGILDLISKNQINKGGAGGANQIAAIAAITNQPSIAFPAYGTATASLSGGNSIGGIISSIGQAVKTGASAFIA
jgi:hypothetical protein